MKPRKPVVIDQIYDPAAGFVNARARVRQHRSYTIRN